MSFFILEHTASDCKARAGAIYTSHGIIDTPVFMPVGTQGSVKAIEQSDIKKIGYNLILGNTYHLYLRPGMEVLEHFHGLHNFIKWDRAILTDSGGYQIFSLSDLRKISDDGVEFKSHIDGSRHYFTPRNVIEYQRVFGSDIMMVLDECTPYPCEYDSARKSMELSIGWARRSKQAFQLGVRSVEQGFEKQAIASAIGKTENAEMLKQVQHDSGQSTINERQSSLFGIGQGSVYHDLRREYLEKLLEIGFDGYAIGGLSVGEPAEIMYEVTDVCTELMPQDKPRYLMGVGLPENILEAIELGIDMFDCVIPTRNARNGQLFTTKGKINIKNAKYKFCEEPIDDRIGNYISSNYSLAYLRHLFNAGELLGLQLATHHNLAFYYWLVKTAREKILSDVYRQWKVSFLNVISDEADI